MARRKKGTAVHGWLVLDKPAGVTSTRALSIVRRLFDATKAGHAGTLDPLATGVLPIAFGEATKTVSHAVDGSKSYRFTVRWGLQTDTDDCEGNAISESTIRPTADDITAVLADFTGQVLQAPPAYSAVKINGKRAYQRARDNESVAPEPRIVEIEALKLIEVPDGDNAVFEVSCGKGTYVRSLARDIGLKLGCLGHITALRRSRVGNFFEADALTMDALEEMKDLQGPDVLQTTLRPIEAALQALTGFRVDQAAAAQLARGQPVLIRGQDVPDASKPVYAMSKGRLIALGEIDKGALKPTRVFNFAE